MKNTLVAAVFGAILAVPALADLSLAHGKPFLMTMEITVIFR